MGNLPTQTPRVPQSVTKPTTIAVVMALTLWITHGVQTNEWTALPDSVGQLVIDAIPVVVAMLYTWIKHILRDKLGYDLHWLG